MVVLQNRIIQSLTGKASLKEVSVQELESIVNINPSFAAGHLLLTKKLFQLNEQEAASIQKQKTAVYFTDIFWLDSLLNDLSGNRSYEKSLAEDVISSQEKQDDIEAEAALTEIEEVALPADDAKETVEEEFQNEAPAIDATVTETAAEAIKEQAPVEEEFNVDRKEFAEHLLADNDEQEEESAVEEKEPEADFNPVLSKILSVQAQEFNKPVEGDAKLPIESEPYYTVDYFDSQGIKLDPSQLGKDKLGRKVRKFTDWLKDMKRVSGQPTDLGTDPEMEKAIQTIAAASNETKEIVTEAMAEILIKEGKTAKAIKLYEKLSFLNPDKSAYFAAKIEHIKGLS